MIGELKSNGGSDNCAMKIIVYPNIASNVVDVEYSEINLALRKSIRYFVSIFIFNKILKLNK